MKSIFSALTLLFFFFALTSFMPNLSSIQAEIENGKTMCSSLTNVGRCTGSAYCTACKNCKYCKYCNNGGSCGVCGKRTKRSYAIPKPKKKNYSPGNRSQKKRHVPSKIPDEYFQSPSYHNNTYTITKKTSLREFGDSKSRVLKRLRVREEVIVLDSTRKFWWKVKYNDKIGWVKKHLLKKKPPTA